MSKQWIQRPHERARRPDTWRVELRDDVEVLECALRGLREQRPNKPPCEMVWELESRWRLELADLREQLSDTKVRHRRARTR
jgi:hypothetical protein